MSTQEAYIVRSVTEVRTEPGAVRIGLEAFRAVSLPGTPGWLTGESMADQGIETEMPNLPRGLQLPPLESRETELRVSALGTGSARVVIAPAGGRVLGEDADWLGSGQHGATVDVDRDRVRGAGPEHRQRADQQRHQHGDAAPSSRGTTGSSSGRGLGVHKVS